MIRGLTSYSSLPKPAPFWPPVVGALGLVGLDVNRFTRFCMLNASPRNSMRCRSLIRNARVRPRSVLKYPGPYSVYGPMLLLTPVVIVAGANAEGFSQQFCVLWAQYTSGRI